MLDPRLHTLHAKEVPNYLLCTVSMEKGPFYRSKNRCFFLVLFSQDEKINYLFNFDPFRTPNDFPDESERNFPY